MDDPITPPLPEPRSALESRPSVPPPRKKKWNNILGWLAIALGLFLAYARAWAWSYGAMGAEGWGEMFGSALLPALIAYVIAGRKSVRNFNRFGMWFSGLSVFFLLITHEHPVSLKEHIAGLMKEASGTKTSSNEGTEFDNLIRDIMRSALDDRKAFEGETSTYDAEMRKLYSAETFSSKAAMQKSIDAVRGIFAADQRYSLRIDGILDRAQVSVDHSHLSDSDRRDFMEGMRKSFGNAKALDIRRQAMAAESGWDDATIALYEFAEANASQMRVDGTHLVITSSSIRSGFNDRLDKAQSLRHKISELNAQLENAQNAALQEAGLTRADIGLQQGKRPTQK